ncbi:MAG: acetolactate decarboxylase [Deltaproteobacteria bacterium HGW-Deltaproteobacteria-6]|jgi:acetolactate decarboxylase|nr:MAG: acetolactate decarboxylase [Deltaproteobacteria bacterium HGW-Deltaproteobacteria-6]
MLYISSPINALLEGLYRDDITIETLKEKGDFGIGTFNNLDGEMIALNGSFFHLDLNGDAYPAASGMKTPFATVCHFQPALTEEIAAPLSYAEFGEHLKRMLPSDNMFYAIHMEGRFQAVETRSVPRTENYRPLSEATDHQKIRHFKEIEGHLVGFYTPSFMPSVNVPGYHFHFIDKTLSAGGHLLCCQPERLDIRLQIFFSMELTLPKTLDYLTVSFTRDAKKDLEKAET